jgi:hypothetical protein
MIAGFLPAAHFALDTSRDEHPSRASVQQEMVDAYAGITRVSVAEIVPERIDRLLRVQFPDGIGPALREKLSISCPRLGKEQGIVHPALRLVRIQFGRNNVVVPGQNDRLIKCDKAFCIPRQACEPSKLVFEFRPRCRIAVRKVQAADQDAINVCLDISAVKILGIAWQSSPRLFRLPTASQDGDTIPSFLTVPNRALTRFLERFGRKLLLGSFQFLQANDIWFRLR